MSAKAQNEFRKRRADAGLCYDCGKDSPTHRRCSECRAKAHERGRKAEKRAKLECFLTYGGRCFCCGEFRTEMLSIDHVNQDGAAHRRELGRQRIWKWAKDNGYPDTLRLACFNCNVSCFQNGGRCSHGS